MMDPCPSAAELERFATGAGAAESVGTHVDRCAACRSAVRECRDNDVFLAGVRAALARGRAVDGHGETDSSGPDLDSGYQILEEIHRGGQGAVYHAVQLRTRREVAIKVLHGGRSAGPRQRERFEREVRIAAGLRHPNIVTVHDSGPLGDGRYGLVMEYIQGLPLDRWSNGLEGARGRDAQRRALRSRLEVMVKVCDAVLCAHQNSIVHRDLKPANILVDTRGEPHVLDFGIARDTGPDQQARLTHTGEFAGTLAYASPEQVSGDPTRVDTRTDIYSLGVIMYELVSGNMPYPVDGPVAGTIRSIEQAEPAPLQPRNPAGRWIDGEIPIIISKAMAKDPARRYQTAAGLRNDLERYLAGKPIEARRDSTWYVLRKAASRHRALAGAAALFLVVLTSFSASMAYLAHRLDKRGDELAAALSASNIERGRSLAAAGNTPLAEDTIFPELIRAGIQRVDGPAAGFAGSPEALNAYWALWDTFRASSCVATLRGLSAPAALLYFDPDGTRLTAVDVRGGVSSWSTLTWKPLHHSRLAATPDRTSLRAAIGPDGNIALLGGGALRIIDPRTGAQVAGAADPDDQALLGAFSPDGARLATIGRDKRLRIRDARAPETVIATAQGDVLAFHDLVFGSPAFSADGRRVAAAAADGSIGLWDASTGALLRTLAPPESLVGHVRSVPATSAIAFGPGGSIAAAQGGHLVVWTSEEGPPLDLGVPGGPIQHIEFLPDPSGDRLVSTGMTAAGASGATVLCSIKAGGPLARMDHASDTTTCAVSPDGQLVASGDTAGRVQVHRVASEPHVRRLPRTLGSIIALSPDGKTLAAPAQPEGGPGRDTVLIDVGTGRTAARFHREGSPLHALSFAPDGKSIFEGEAGGRVTQWLLPSGSPALVFASPSAAGTEHEPRSGSPTTDLLLPSQNRMRLSPDGRLLARARDDGLIDLWDARAGQWIGWLDGGSAESAVIDFSRDSRTLVAQEPERCILWDVQTRRPVRTIPTPRAYPAARFSPVAPLLAYGDSGSLAFLDTARGRPATRNSVPATAGIGMAFHPGGTVFIASAFDSSIRLWDLRTGRELLALRKHTAIIGSLSLTPDGNTLISADFTGLVLAWDLGTYAAEIQRELVQRAAERPAPRP